MNLLTMKPGRNRPSNKKKGLVHTSLVEVREPTEAERDAGAHAVFVRRERATGVLHEILATDGREAPSQFGVPGWVMDENRSDCATWHRARREQRGKASNTNLRPAMARRYRFVRA